MEVREGSKGKMEVKFMGNIPEIHHQSRGPRQGDFRIMIQENSTEKGRVCSRGQVVKSGEILLRCR